MVDVRLLGTSGSLTANLLLLGAIAASVAALPGHRWGRPYQPETWHGGPLHFPIDLWQPTIDNGDVASGRRDCPSPRAAAGAFYLLDAPVPGGFADGRPERSRPLYACIRHDPLGRVLEVRLPGRSAAAGRGQELRDLIRARWRFVADRPATGEVWQRVRLTRWREEI